MEELIMLLSDGKSRTLEMLAMEMDTSLETIKRNIEFLEQVGVIKRIGFSEMPKEGQACNGCSGCGTGKKSCAGCMPEGGFQNMGVMWEINNV